jgi:hypothetical protein
VITGACVSAFLLFVGLVYWLVTPTRSKPPRSQYTLPPLKPTAHGRKWRAERKLSVDKAAAEFIASNPDSPFTEDEIARLIDVDRAGEHAAQHHHTKHEFVEALIDAKPDESLSHSDRIEHDHGGSHE